MFLNVLQVPSISFSNVSLSLSIIKQIKAHLVCIPPASSLALHHKETNVASGRNSLQKERICSTVNEILGVNALDLRVTGPVGAGDGGRTWVRAEEFAAHGVKGRLIPHTESLSVEAAWRSKTGKCDCGLVPVLFSSPFHRRENPTNLWAASQHQLGDSWTFSTSTVEWLTL